MKDIWLPGLGVLPKQTDPLINWVGTTPELKAAAQQAFFQLLQQRYPVFIANGSVVNGSPVLAPALDPNADYATWDALVADDFQKTTGSPAPAQTAYDQIKSRVPGSVIVVRMDDLNNVLAGAPNYRTVGYAVIRSKELAQKLIPGDGWPPAAIADPTSTGTVPTTAPEPVAKKTSTGVWIVGGAALLGAGALIFGGAHRRPMAHPPL